MYIDTTAANEASKAPEAKSPRTGIRHSEETTPLLETFVNQPPPPSYLEATTPNPWNNRRSGDEGSRLLAFDERGAGESPPDQRSDGLYKGLVYRRRSLREHCTQRRTIKAIVAIVFLIMLIIIIALATRKQDKTTVSPIPAVPAVPSQPKKEYPIRWPSGCKKDYNTNKAEFTFGSPSELRIQEAVHQLDGPYKRVTGWIHVAPAPAEQAAGTIQAKFAYAVSKSIDIDSVKFASSATGLTIGDVNTPDGGDGIKAGTACLGMSLVIYMASGAKLENFDVSSVHLGMQIHAGVDFSVTNSTTISLTTGTLDAPPFDSRETRLKTISGSISGKYSLLDLLSIDTKSGSVNIAVAPKEAVNGGSESAVFRASSLSGTIRTDFERKNIPDRDFQVAVDTKVGSIEGSFIHGSKTTITSVAGSIIATLYPFEAGAYENTIETSTHSGETKLKIGAPLVNPGSVMNKLTSSHKTISGAMDLTYPQEWEGHLEGSTLNGSLHLEGRDLELVKKGEGVPGGSTIEAKKGKGGSKMTFNSISGSCEVKVGKL
ncbi:hypothetical protein BCR34DRAFT_587152 [Clohesyomyces aquaticus]|uniref:Adhesin domain-containing protein n=1 Tax=Clohesyomyces aquaticus TaxID=1231657 RepID=A0A1Y1ZQP9_9PLEO|nr:hypothetical protein BCR34DRAFT_587152 [Clohesyomyces aquaticus]